MKSFNKISIFWLVLILSAGTSFGQTITVRGRVFDKETGQPVSHGLISINPGNISTTSDMNGDYLLYSSQGIRQLSAQVLGYRPLTIDFYAKSDTVIYLYLQVLPYELDEVTVTVEQVKNVRITQQGNIVITPAAMKETPRVFSEPDLMKSLQLMPGVIAGKDGSSDIYVRGGGAGQNIILANGCYFFLPSHFLGMLSPVDLDFLDNAQIYKDYFPAELGGGAGSVIALRFKKPRTDSLHAQLRLGMLSSGFTVELPVKSQNLNITAGLKRGNYGIIGFMQKKILPEEVIPFLPSDDYAFYDGYVSIDHSSENLGKISYLFFGNYDRGKQENEISSKNADTILFYLDRISTGWKSMVHALQWEPPAVNGLIWKLDLNYNRLTMDREMFRQTEKRFAAKLFDVIKTTYSFSPTSDIIGSSLTVSGKSENLRWRAGLSDRIRLFSPNITAKNISYKKSLKYTYGETVRLFEPALFFHHLIISPISCFWMPA